MLIYLIKISRGKKKMSFVSRIPAHEGSLGATLKPYPEIASSVSIMTEYVMRSTDVQFTLAQRELIATYVSDLNSCTFAARTHQAAAETLGIKADLFPVLIEDIDSAELEDKLKPVFKYVKKLTLSPTQMTQADADAIFNAGWDEKSFHFAIMICAMFNMYNRILEGYGIENTPDFWEKAGKGIAESGYLHVGKQAHEEKYGDDLL
jgi:uncharacterized peroxidase-related enzyme